MSITDIPILSMLLPAHQKAYIVELTALAPLLTMLLQEVVIGAVRSA